MTRHFNRSIEDVKSTRTPLLWLAGLFLLGLAVRMWRLEWQPLWWDEGYSVYFATEPLAHMLWLTAHDIHPPLYYALLHGWAWLWGGPAPDALRAFSVLLGAAAVPATFWLGRIMFPRRPLVVWVGTGLIALSPMHLYYSQEVRMYALATVLSIVASATLWITVARLRADRPALLPLVGYGMAGTLLLYTLYYGALVLLAHALWVVWIAWRRRALDRAALIRLGSAWLAMAIAYLPWLIYALPKLVRYVAAKVESDQDAALGLLAYTVRHLNAFLIGHVTPQFDTLSTTLAVALWVGIAGILLLIGPLLATRSDADIRSPVGASVDFAPLSAAEALGSWLAIPFLCAFLISLRNPFFPDGSERLLLIALPSFVLLLAYGCALAIERLRALGWLATGMLAAAAVMGVGIFYTTPRHTDEDYRPLLADVARMGRDDDTLIAIFPWQVGYWRAYRPTGIAGPVERLLDDFAVAWNPRVSDALSESLARGSVWFPEPLAFGSTLPAEMESWLAENAANLENRWYSPTTRLTAWTVLPMLQPQQPAALFGNLTLFGSAIAQEPVAADNSPLATTLLWDDSALAETGLGATLRLMDGDGRTWASRDYAPLGSFAQRVGGDLPLALETPSLAIPAGTPPGVYGIYLGVKQGDVLLPAQVDGMDVPQTLMRLGDVVVTLPNVLPAVARLPMAQPLARPATQEGMTILGATLPESGADSVEILAGEMLDMAVFARREAASPAVDWQLRLRLAGSGSGTEWVGWPLEGHPVSVWEAGFATTLPVSVPLPWWLPSWKYWVLASWVHPESGATMEEIALGSVTIRQREANFEEQPLAQNLDAPAQFATHALLKSYEMQIVEGRLEVRLAWEALQPILPPHEIFVHVDVADASPPTVAQADGPPTTAAGRAPTGTWQAGEELITVHSVLLPDGEFPANARIHVGMFDPASGVRLPVSIEGTPVGDAVELPATF